MKTIGKHINKALKEELDNSVVAKFATTALDGKIYQVEHYNLDMIISVGYRVKSNRGVEFRKWANKVIIEVITSRVDANILVCILTVRCNASNLFSLIAYP